MLYFLLEYLIIGIMGVGILIILIGFFKALYSFIQTEWRISFKDRTVPHLSLVRHDLGVYLLLGLEFIIAGDIIETILNPSLDHLIVLGGIVVIRIAISYFLGKEVHEVNQHISLQQDRESKNKK